MFYYPTCYNSVVILFAAGKAIHKEANIKAAGCEIMTKLNMTIKSTQVLSTA